MLAQDVRRFLERWRSTRDRSRATLATCAQQLRRIRERVGVLRSGLPAGSGVHPFGDALDRLEASTEALTTVEEEFAAQHDELDRSVALLEHERAKYLGLFEHATDACLVTDGDGTIGEANATARSLLHTTEEEVIGRTLSSFVMSRDVPRLRAVLKALVECSLSQEIELRLRRKPMNTALACFAVRPVRYETGTLAALRWTVRMAATPP